MPGIHPQIDSKLIRTTLWCSAKNPKGDAGTVRCSQGYQFLPVVMLGNGAGHSQHVCLLLDRIAKFLRNGSVVACPLLLDLEHQIQSPMQGPMMEF
jgi:hypothetical protein